MKLKTIFIFLSFNLLLSFRAFSLPPRDTVIVYSPDDYPDGREAKYLGKYFNKNKQNIDTLYGVSWDFFEVWNNMQKAPYYYLEHLISALSDKPYIREYTKDYEIVSEFGKPFVYAKNMREQDGLRLVLKFVNGDCIYEKNNKIIIVSNDLAAFPFCLNTIQINDAHKKSLKNILGGAAFYKVGKNMIAFSIDADEKIIVQNLKNYVGLSPYIADKTGNYIYRSAKNYKFRVIGRGLIFVGLGLMLYEGFNNLNNPPEKF